MMVASSPFCVFVADGVSCTRVPRERVVLLCLSRGLVVRVSRQLGVRDQVRQWTSLVVLPERRPRRRVVGSTGYWISSLTSLGRLVFLRGGISSTGLI